MECQSDTYYCKAGDMSLSQNVNKILAERFPIIQNQSNNNIGSGYFNGYRYGIDS